MRRAVRRKMVMCYFANVCYNLQNTIYYIIKNMAQNDVLCIKSEWNCKNIKRLQAQHWLDVSTRKSADINGSIFFFSFYYSLMVVQENE